MLTPDELISTRWQNKQARYRVARGRPVVFEVVAVAPRARGWNDDQLVVLRSIHTVSDTRRYFHPDVLRQIYEQIP